MQRGGILAVNNKKPKTASYWSLAQRLLCDTERPQVLHRFRATNKTGIVTLAWSEPSTNSSFGCYGGGWGRDASVHYHWGCAFNVTETGITSPRRGARADGSTVTLSQAGPGAPWKKFWQQVWRCRQCSLLILIPTRLMETDGSELQTNAQGMCRIRRPKRGKTCNMPSALGLGCSSTRTASWLHLQRQQGSSPRVWFNYIDVRLRHQQEVPLRSFHQSMAYASFVCGMLCGICPWMCRPRVSSRYLSARHSLLSPLAMFVPPVCLFMQHTVEHCVISVGIVTLWKMYVVYAAPEPMVHFLLPGSRKI